MSLNNARSESLGPELVTGLTSELTNGFYSHEDG